VPESEFQGEQLLWKWVELPRFANFCKEIAEKVGVSYVDAFDEVRWAIMNDVCRSPFAVTHPDPRFNDEAWRYVRVAESPGRTGLPALVATFRVARYPELRMDMYPDFGVPGVLEGREMWIEEELRQLGGWREQPAG
jgi:hypothetical protein